MFDQLSNKQIYDNSYVGFEFEFFTPMEKRSVAAKFARALGKKIKWFSNINQDFIPTHEEFKVSPVYSNGYKEVTLETGMLPYHEAVHMFLKISHVIEAIGYTTDRCSVKTKVQLDTKTLGLDTKMHSLNQFKYLLGLNEKKIFELWPNRENDESKIYQNHLSFIQPKHIFTKIISESFIERMSPAEFRFPQSDFFANDFSQLSKGKLVTNYIGGKNYTRKRKESVATINIIIERLYETLKENWQYNFDEKIKISKIAIGRPKNPKTPKNAQKRPRTPKNTKKYEKRPKSAKTPKKRTQHPARSRRSPAASVAARGGSPRRSPRSRSREGARRPPRRSRAWPRRCSRSS
jgi:hypothetical protein